MKSFILFSCLISCAAIAADTAPEAPATEQKEEQKEPKCGNEEPQKEAPTTENK